MTNPPNIDAIIAELREATGPDRRLDVLIGCAVGYAPDTPGCEWAKEPHWQYLPVPRITERIGCADKSGNIAAHWEAPLYTGSLDAAMTLAEPNWWLQCGGPLSPEAYGYSREEDRKPWGGFHMIGPPYSSGGQAATLPLAICIAALRVRSALIGEVG